MFSPAAVQAGHGTAIVIAGKVLEQRVQLGRLSVLGKLEPRDRNEPVPQPVNVDIRFKKLGAGLVARDADSEGDVDRPGRKRGGR